MTSDDRSFLSQLESGQIAPADFNHHQHLRAAYLLLSQHDFVTALYRLTNALRQLTISAGAPEKLNITTTVAFMSLIAERMHANPVPGFKAFVDQNPELLSGDALQRYYQPDQLASDFARQCFALPVKR